MSNPKYLTDKPCWHQGRYVKAGEVVQPPLQYEHTKKDGSKETRDFKPSKGWKLIEEPEVKPKTHAPKPEVKPEAPKRVADKAI